MNQPKGDNGEDLRAKVRELERKLSLTRLQVNRLLNVTQAINSNVKAEELFDMYAQFLNWELDVKRLVLLVRSKDDDTLWSIGTALPRHEFNTNQTFTLNELLRFERPSRIDATEPNAFFRRFDAVIPVAHKDSAIACAFIGGYDQADPGKIQIITTLTNVIAVAIENKRLFKKQVRQEHEMRLAAEMQHKLIPSEFPQCASFEAAHIYEPHYEVGGDFFDVINYRPNAYLFCVADIAGKGLAAAILMANFEAALRVLVEKSHEEFEFIRELNRAVNRITKGDRFITFFAAEFDDTTNELRYINAGHVPPLLLLRGGEELILLDKGCTLLGTFNQLKKIEIGKILIEEDALLVVFTDGITDVRDEAGTFFDEQKLADFARQHATFAPQDFNNQLWAYLQQYKGNTDFPDDITVLTCKFSIKHKQLNVN